MGRPVCHVAFARQRRPAPGGWNRIELVVDDLAAEVERLRHEGVTFRNDVVTGPGGSQILVDDPFGNPVELFQPASQVSETTPVERHGRAPRPVALH